MTAASRTYLIIDDDLKFAAFVQRVAESLGLQARVLTDPTHLEMQLANSEPDVITLDMDMPRRHGLNVLKALSVRQLDQRVVIISGTPPVPDTETQSPAFAVAATLTKPARKLEIEAVILGVLRTATTCHPPHDAN